MMSSDDIYWLLFWSIWATVAIIINISIVSTMIINHDPTGDALNNCRFVQESAQVACYENVGRLYQKETK